MIQGQSQITVFHEIQLNLFYMRSDNSVCKSFRFEGRYELKACTKEFQVTFAKSDVVCLAVMTKKL